MLFLKADTLVVGVVTAPAQSGLRPPALAQYHLLWTGEQNMSPGSWYPTAQAKQGSCKTALYSSSFPDFPNIFLTTPALRLHFIPLGIKYKSR